MPDIEVHTVGATNVRATKATMKGAVVNADLEEFVWSGKFQYGLTNDYQSETVRQGIPPSSGGLFQAQTYGSLPPNTTFHFRAAVYHGELGPGYGDDMTFTTKRGRSPNPAMLFLRHRRGIATGGR